MPKTREEAQADLDSYAKQKGLRAARRLDRMTIGERLRWLRQKRNMTLRDVMCFTGLSVSHLSEIERGRAKPSLTP